MNVGWQRMRRTLGRLLVVWGEAICLAAGSSAAQVETPASLPLSRNEPSLRVAAGLELDRVLSDPTIANPLYLNFDERGQLWVVEYRQYPWPAGLKLVSRDNVWRNVYDPPFPPPPPHAADSPFRGRDRISIHADRDGDGTLEHHEVFLDGLNLATAALKGRGGVFVMNPPYLLFYADQDNDNRPDSLTPRILLSGFGIEDTHSIANSLRWGPDGWIYGAEGSTVSAAVVRHGSDGLPIPGEAPIHSLGQNLWRYHPEQHRYEIFAEGGGNAFGVEFDGQGRVYSGHNGGDTRGFHYVQGGYYLKNFGKHGLHSNPFVFGHYGAMKHHSVERFTHTFEIYEASELPTAYHGKMLSVSPILHYVMLSEIFPDGSTRQTKDLGPVVTPGEGAQADWFIPVDIQTGPDGAAYVADWFAVQASHLKGSVGETNPDLGRVIRIRGDGVVSFPRMDLGGWSSERLIAEGLRHPNRWFRETALRLLGDRHDSAAIPQLASLATDPECPQAVWALWGLHQVGGLKPELADPLLRHPDPAVRAWAVRLFAEQGDISAEVWQLCAERAAVEPDVEVRLQMANSTRRLPAAAALDVLGNLVLHHDDSSDPMLPRAIWWGIEAQAGDRSTVLAWLHNRALWTTPGMLASQTVENLMTRYASLGTQDDLQACARLLQIAPTPEARQRLAAGFSRAFEGRTLPPLPDEMIGALSQADSQFGLILGVRRHEAESIHLAVEAVRNAAGSVETRVQYIQALGDVVADPTQTVPALLQTVRSGQDERLVVAALNALQRYDQPEIASAVVAAYPGFSLAVQATAQAILASRAGWAKELLSAMERQQVAANALSQDTVARMRWHSDPELAQQLQRMFPPVEADPGTLDQRIELLEQLARSGQGNPVEGQTLFHETANCGKCHRMFGRGGEVGPDLTSYNRSNLHLLLLAVIHPNAEIREGYENLTVFTDDGRVLTGFKIDETEHLLVLRTADGQNQSLAKTTIEEQRPNKSSLMPTGLLDPLSDSQLRDLLAFLTSTTPPL